MPLRPDREDLTSQRERVAAARAGLARALADLAGEAALAHGDLRSRAKRPPEPDMPAVYAAVTRVREAENVLDIAKADLATAGGQDL
jgi:multidrug efflux pump subunit AcrA (membrane-fusion protein)